MFEKPKTETHKCGGEICNNQIPVGRNFCLICQHRLIKAGLCAKCGKNPRKEKRGRSQQSNYCEACYPSIEEIALRKPAFKPHPPGVRPAGSAENTNETRRGTSN
jgi:hypothetical protein